MKKQVRPWQWVLLLLIFFAALRLIHFYADPDLSLTWSTGTFLTDELYHGGNGLKKALTGQWLLSDFNYILMDPLMPVLQWLAFKALGISLWVARLPANLLNLLLMFSLVGYVYRRAPGDRAQAAALAAFLIGTNYYFFVYGRLALLDLPMAALGFLAFIFYQWALENRRISRWVYAGLLLLLSMLMKASAANFFLAVIIFLLLELASKRATKKQAATTILLLLTVAAAHFVILKLIRHALPIAASSLRSDTLIARKLPNGLVQAFYLYLTSLGNPFILNNAGLFLVLIVSLALLYRRYGQIRSSAADHAMIALLISTLIFHGFFNYHPPRYYMVLSIPLTWFAATLPARLSTAVTRRRVVLFAVAMVIVANGWNIVKLGDYLLHPKYTFYQTARMVGRLIAENSSRSDFAGCLLLDNDVHTSIPFALGIDFDYGAHPAGSSAHHIYLIDSHPGLQWPLLGRFRIYEKYPLNLYRLEIR